VTVKHEEITGFMPAMTMPYEVADAKALDALAPGDLINAKLVVFSNGAHLTDIKKVGSAPLEKPPAEAAMPTASSGFELLRPGEAVPAGKFLDQDGKARTFDGFKGAPVVMTFIYTECPMPTFCPLLDRNFAAIQNVVDGRAIEDPARIEKIAEPLQRERLCLDWSECHLPLLLTCSESRERKVDHPTMSGKSMSRRR
jgi:protein SCO1/2